MKEECVRVGSSEEEKGVAVGFMIPRMVNDSNGKGCEVELVF